MRMDENADASQVIVEPPLQSWRHPPGRPHITWMKTIQGDLSSMDLELHKARELAQNQPLWRMTSDSAIISRDCAIVVLRSHFLLDYYKKLLCYITFHS